MDKYGLKHYDSSKNEPWGALRSRARIKLSLIFRRHHCRSQLSVFYEFGTILILIKISNNMLNQNTKFEIKSNRLVRIQSMTLRRISNRILKDKVTSKVSYESKVSSLFFWLLILLAWPCSLALKKLKFRKSKFKTLKFSNQTKNGVCVTKWTFNC